VDALRDPVAHRAEVGATEAAEREGDADARQDGDAGRERAAPVDVCASDAAGPVLQAVRRVIPESWRKPIPDGEMNPISRSLMLSAWRFIAVVAAIYMAGWLAHGAADLFMAGWNSR
jgi:hypothetical protein